MAQCICLLKVLLDGGGHLDDDVGGKRAVSFSSCPAELVKDGDLILLVNGMLEMRGRETVRISKVSEHADECMVRAGQVRELDRVGSAAADEAADFGRRRVDFR